jgi:hypothetical protein
MRNTRMALAAALVLALPLGFFVSLAVVPDARAAEVRTYVSQSTFLEVDLGNGKKVSGYCKSLKGGSARSEVVNEKLGPDHVVRKHIAGVKYEPIVAQITPGTFTELFACLRAGTRVNGTVTTLSYDLKPAAKRQFQNALVTRFALPVLDGASKEPAYTTIALEAEVVRTVPPDGAAPTSEKQKVFLPANFRVTIAGVETKRVSKVEGLDVGCKAVQNSVGELRDYTKEPASCEFANLKIQLSAADAKTWQDWADDFIVKGNNGQDKEKTLRVELLTVGTVPEVFLAVEAKGVGIFALDADVVEANADNIARYTAELYAEEWQVVAPGMSEATAPAVRPTAPVAPTGLAPRRG